MTQKALAGLAGVSRVTLGKLERGELAAISLKIFDIILGVLGYEIDIKQKTAHGLPALKAN